MEPEQYALMARVERQHWWYVGMRRLASALLDDELPLPHHRASCGRTNGRLRVLDAGCGTGGTTAWLQRYGPVVGVDLAAEAAGFWRQRGLPCMARGSVTELPFRAETFDLVTCFDVLYHRGVAAEGPALAEFWRVLRPGGVLLLLVPIVLEQPTLEDPSIDTPEERRRHYWQEDHVRLYGGDFRDRLAEAGFKVTVDGWIRTLDQATLDRYGLFPLEDIYVCAKPRAGVAAAAG